MAPHFSRHLVRWALSILALFAVLFLNAYLEGQPSETDALQLSAAVAEDLAVEQQLAGVEP